MRFYQFDAEEILDDAQPDLALDIDPKLAWALRHPECFPIDINTADHALILRVPGIGTRSAERIVDARRHRKLRPEHVSKIGVVMKRARYFLCFPGTPAFTIQEAGPAYVRRVLSEKQKPAGPVQLSLFDSARLDPAGLDACAG